MSETSHSDQIYEDLSSIRDVLNKNNSKIDPLGLREKKFKTNSMSNDVSKRIDGRIAFNLPILNNLEGLDKDKEGVNTIVEGVLVQADILSKRTDGNPDARNSFKKLVDSAIERKVITRDRIAELSFQREEEIQTNKLVKESKSVIDEVSVEISRIRQSLENITTPEEAAEIDIVELQDNRRKLIVLSAQIKDRQTINEIENTIKEITKTISKVIEIISIEVDRGDRIRTNEQYLPDLQPGTYNVQLSMPDIRRNNSRLEYSAEVVELTNEDEEVLTGQHGYIGHEPFKKGDLVVRLKYMTHGQNNTRTYHLDEIQEFNRKITANDFKKIELAKK